MAMARPTRRSPHTCQSSHWRAWPGWFARPWRHAHMASGISASGVKGVTVRIASLMAITIRVSVGNARP